MLVLLCVTVWSGYFLFRFVFFFNDTATTEIYTLSLHDALPIYTNDIVKVPFNIYRFGKIARTLTLANEAKVDILR